MIISIVFICFTISDLYSLASPSMSFSTDFVDVFSEHELRMKNLLCHILPHFHLAFDLSNELVESTSHKFSLEHLIDILFFVFEECKSGTCKKDENSILFKNQMSDHISALKQFQISMKDFETIKLIGKGAFGEVYLVRYKANSMVIYLIVHPRFLVSIIAKNCLII